MNSVEIVIILIKLVKQAFFLRFTYLFFNLYKTIIYGYIIIFKLKDAFWTILFVTRIFKNEF